MKNKLIALIMVWGFGVNAEEISGTIYDLDYGRTQIINATVTDRDRSHNEIMARYRAMNAELSESIARMRAESAAQDQVWELRRQTELLEKIADK